MTQQSSNHHGGLKKVLGVSALFAAAMGGVTSQSSFVSLLNGAGNGASFFVAIFIAFILTLCYVFTYLELSLMMPKAGGLGTYTTVALGHFPAIVVVLTGYIAATPFGGVAELMLLEKIIDTVYPGVFPHIGIILLVLLTVLNILGINIFSSVQNTIVYVLLVSLLIIGFSGLHAGNAKGIACAEMWQQLSATKSSVLSLTVLALWSFAGLEFVCPLLEEAKRPEKNLPKAMLLAAVMLLIVYSLIAFAGMRQIPAAALSSSETPHWLLVNALFTKTGGFVIVVFAVTATSSTVNAIIAGVPRMLYGMAHHQQLPAIFKKVHPQRDTPWFGILFFSATVMVPFLLLNNDGGLIFLLLISSVVLWLMAYIMAHVNVLLLRKKYPSYKRPFKTPLYPLPQIAGIAGMAYAIWNNSPSPEMAANVYGITGLIVAIAVLYAFVWIKFKMKKRLFAPEPMEEALAD